MFCPKCGSLLYPEGDEMVCRKCGYHKKKEGSRVVVSSRKEKELTVIEENEDTNVLPKTNVRCPKCGNNEAYWILLQTRAADEPETRIYTCTKCGHRWREY
ncbi:MAG: transcription factor S [Thermoplasmata archaeon]|nr:MAG: transcription factor S [Thermoplasmata archaeon]MCD6147209.1 transcription factor S [Thermoplasmata archaeon]HDH81842.1 transcription factor S [Thermoplasmatales archaeon]